MATKKFLVAEIKSKNKLIEEWKDIATYDIRPGRFFTDLDRRMTWEEEAKRRSERIEDLKAQLKNKDKEIKSLEQEQINIRKNNLKKTDLLGEKIESLQDKIKSLKGLKSYFIKSTDDYGQYTIEATDDYEIGDYTIFDLDEEEIFRIKTATITSMSTREF